MNSVELYVAMSGIIAIIFAVFFSKEIYKEKATTHEVGQVSNCIKQGSKLFLRKQYIYLLLIGIVITIALSLSIEIKIGVTFLIGSIFSMFITYVFICIATLTNIKVLEETKKGIQNASKVALSGATAIGIGSVALGTLAVTIIYISFNSDVKSLFGFGLGAAYISLFSRICGGLCPKLVHARYDSSLKLDENTKSSLVIMDCIGDNVSKIGSMSIDFFGTYVAAIIGAITLGSSVAEDLVEKATAYPMIIVSIGIIATLIGLIFNRNIKVEKAYSSLNKGIYIAQIIILISSAMLSKILFGDFNGFIASTSGVLVAAIIGKTIEFYTSSKYKLVKNTNTEYEKRISNIIIEKIVVGIKSILIPIASIILSIIISYYIMGGGDNNASGLYGISLSVIGMISTMGLIIAFHSYSAVFQSASCIIKDTNVEKEITDIDNLADKASYIGKAIAICSAALTSLVLVICFSQVASLEEINILKPLTLIGGLAGAAIPFWFSSLILKSILKSNIKIIDEIKDTEKDTNYELKYKTHVEFIKSLTLKSTIKPMIIAIISPILIGFILGVEALGSFICGTIVTCILLGLFMTNVGCIFCNENKVLDKNKFDVEANTMVVIFKDKVAPTLNTLMKFIVVISLVMGSLIFEYGGLILALFN